MTDALRVHHFGNPNGEPLLAIHGVSAHGRRFLPIAPSAFPSFRVIAPDLRGHGQSPGGRTSDEPVLIEDHLDDLLRVLDDAGVERCAVVGHSFGGCLGTHLLARSPERVASLVLLDPAIGLLGERTSQLADLMIGADRHYDSLDDLVVARRAGRGESAVPHSDADTRLAAVETSDGWRTPWDRNVVRCAWAEMSRPLPKLPVRRPTLLLDATQANMVGPAQHEHFAAQLGDALEVERMDLGHMLYWDDADAVSARVAQFLAALGGGAR